MARVTRINYKEAAKAKVTGRFRELFVVFLLAIAGILVSVSLNAQSSHMRLKQSIRTQEKQCELLEKKRHAKVKRTGHNRVSKAVKPLPQQTTRAKAMSPYFITSRVRQADNFQLYVIREMVATYLNEQNANAPIELAPLVLSVNDQKLTTQDNNPFLIAVEFARQGRTIEISDETQASVANQVRSMMIGLGVPEERISITSSNTAAEDDNDTRLKINRRVEFKVI